MLCKSDLVVVLFLNSSNYNLQVVKSNCCGVSAADSCPSRNQVCATHALGASARSANSTDTADKDDSYGDSFDPCCGKCAASLFFWR